MMTVIFNEGITFMKIHILIIIYICTGVALLGQTNESGTNTPSTNTTAMTSETGTNTTKVQTSADSDDSDDAPVIRMQVVATKTPKRISDTAADVTVITEEDLSASGAESVGEVLRANGIVVTENKSSRTVGDLIYVQGLDPTKLLILIDGQRVRPGAMGSITALSRVSLSSIKRIEIVKGPNSYLWGSDAMAGVIYIETKKGDAAKGFHGNIGGSYKNNFYLDADNHLVRPYAEFSYAVPSASFTLGGSFEYGNMWLSPYTLKTIPGYPEEYKVRNERDAYRNFDIHAGSKFHFADIHALNLSGSYQQERSPLQEGSIEKNEFRKIMGNIAYQLYPNASLDISVRSGINYDAAKRVAHSQYLDDYYLFHNDEIMAVYYLNDTVAFKGGYAFELEHFNEKHNRKTYNQQNHALFFGGDIKVREPVDLDVTAGARYQMNMRGATGFSENTILNSLSPQLGVVFKPVTILALKGNIGHSFKAPDLRTAFRDYFDHSWFFLGPNPNLKPESSWGYSAAVEFLPFKQLSFNAGIYRNDLKNLIAHDETGDYYKTLPLMTPVNIGRAYTWEIGRASCRERV